MEKPKSKRCEHSDCKKKIGLLGFTCKCNKTFCSKHRHPEDHQCLFDHKSNDISILENKLVKVTSEKVIKI